MSIILIAGPQLSASASHCAGVGRWAFADDARLNAEHWKAAAAGEPGYRRQNQVEPVSSPALSPTEQKGAVGVELAGARNDHLDLKIPDDLSIPAFLRCVPFGAEFPQFPADATSAVKEADALSGADFSSSVVED